MFKSKTKLGSICLAALCLVALGAASFAQRHYMMAAALRPEVKINLSASVEREDKLVPVEQAQVVKQGETLDWTINSENAGNGAALDYKAVGHVPAGMSFVAGSAKAEGSAKVVYSIDAGKHYSATP